MEQLPAISYFLGANSHRGFFPLYQQFFNPSQWKGLYLLKGGATCGRSALLRRVGQGLENSGHQVEYIQCSLDAQALDGVVVPSLNVALLNSTPPHLVEPQVPELSPCYLNVGEDTPTGQPHGMEGTIATHTKGYQTCYHRSQRALQGGALLLEEGRATLTTEELLTKLEKRGRGILSREGKVKGTGGAEHKRFLGGITCQGQISHFDTADALCQRVYVLSDSYGLGASLLEQLRGGMIERGYDVISCPSPLEPERLEHLLIPNLSLAFVTSTPTLPYEKKPYRHIRIDAMADGELLYQHKRRLKFGKKMTAALLEESATALQEAKNHYDQLETLYHPYVNFDSLYQRGAQLVEGLLAEGKR